MPELIVTKPKTSSPLIGLQQRASLYWIFEMSSSITSASCDAAAGSLRGVLGRLLPLDLGGSGAAFLVGFAREVAQEQLLDGPEIESLCRDQGVYLRSGPHLEVAGQIGYGFVDRDGQFPVLELPFELLAAHARMLGLLFAQERLDLVARFRRDHEVQPVRFGRLVLLREDLDDVAVVQQFAKRDRAVVHLAAHARRAQAGVDIEGEVEQRGPLGELAQIAVGREDEDLARSRLGVEALGQRVGRVLHQLAQAAEPLLAGLGPCPTPL